MIHCLGRSLSFWSPEPVRSFRHRYFEPGAFARFTVLYDRDTGDRKDLAGVEQPKPGGLPEAPGEESRLRIAQKKTSRRSYSPPPFVLTSVFYHSL